MSGAVTKQPKPGKRDERRAQIEESVRQSMAARAPMRNIKAGEDAARGAGRSPKGVIP
jgi:hypothetical protein